MNSKYELNLPIVLWLLAFIKYRLCFPIHARQAMRQLGQLRPNTLTFMEIAGQDVVLKASCHDTAIIEFRTIQYLSKRTSVPVPVVYFFCVQRSCMPETPDLGIIIMKRIRGTQLWATWNDLTTEQKAFAFDQVRSYLVQLRSLLQPPPIGRISSVIGALYDERISDLPFGPFESEKEFNLWRISIYTWLAIENFEFRLRLQKFRQRMSGQHRILFTHGDLHMKNIHVDVQGSGLEDVRIVGIIDWEMSGWLPEYWERVRMTYDESDEDWCRFAQEMFPQYDAEAELDRELTLLAGISGS